MIRKLNRESPVCPRTAVEQAFRERDQRRALSVHRIVFAFGEAYNTARKLNI